MAKKPINKSTFEQSQLDAKRIQALDEMNRLMLNMYDYTLELTKQYKLQDNFVEQILGNYTDFKNVSSAVLQVEKQLVAAEKQGNKVLSETLKIQYNLLQIEIERQAVEEKINKQLENSVSKISEFAKKIPFVGGLLSKHLEKGAKKFAKELSLAAAEGQTGLGSVAKTMTKSFGKGGTVLLGVAALGAALYGAYQLIAGMDETISHTAKNLGMSKSEVTDMAMAANAMGLSMEKVLHIVEDLNKAYGGINVINAQNIDQFEDQIKLTNTLVKGFGLSTEEAAGLTLNADLAGSSLERVTYEVMSQNAALEASGVYLGNQNQVLKDISKMSKTNAMIFGKNATALAKAATAAQLLGSNIEKQLSSAEGMLDIENSIQKEMRARALLGADLNFDTIRLASLNGDVTGVLKGQVEAFKKVGDLSTKNTVQIGAFADAMGMSKDEAVQMSKNLVLAQKAGLDLQAFMEGKISDSDLQKAAKTLKGEERTRFENMIAQKKAASVQEEFNQALAGLKQALLPLLEPITKVVTFFAKLLTGINDATGGFAGMTLGLGLLVAGVYKLVQGFRKMSAAIDSVIALGERAMQTGGGADIGSSGKGKGRSGGFKRIGKAFSKGGFKGGFKAMGRMASSGLSGAYNMASAAQSNLGVGTGTTAGAAPGSTSAVGKLASKGGILGKLGNALSGGFGKLLGPIFGAISGIANISSMISDARAQAATGNAPSPGSFGKSLVQSAAYPIANLALNLIPGVGTILSFADGILSMMGISPIKWITDNLIGLIPDSAFTGLGEMALGDSVKAGANTAMDARAQDATLQVNDFMIDTNPNDKIGGVLDNRSVETMISLLGEMVNLLGERQQVVIGDAAVEQIGRRASARKSFR
jgi:hypothetical protein